MAHLDVLGRGLVLLGHARFAVAVAVPAICTARVALSDRDDGATRDARAGWLRYWCVSSLLAVAEASFPGRVAYWCLARSGGRGRALFLALLRLGLAERLASSRACDHLYAYLERALLERERLIRFHLDRASAHASARCQTLAVAGARVAALAVKEYGYEAWRLALVYATAQSAAEELYARAADALASPKAARKPAEVELVVLPEGANPESAVVGRLADGFAGDDDAAVPPVEAVPLVEAKGTAAGAPPPPPRPDSPGFSEDGAASTPASPAKVATATPLADVCTAWRARGESQDGE